jgi:site-specific recombinase XerD
MPVGVDDVVAWRHGPRIRGPRGPVNDEHVIGPQGAPWAYAAQVGRAPATERAYASDWADFAAWCTARGARSLPASPATVAAYVDEAAERLRVATVRRRVAAVRARHLDGALTPPTATAPVQAAVARAEWRLRHDCRGTTPLGIEELRAVSSALPESIAGLRDRALLLLGYGGGLTPGELAALTFDDIRLVPAGIAVRTSRGRATVPFGSDVWLCSVRAWKAWCRAAGLRDGPALRPVDRHGRVQARGLGVRGVTRVVQRSVARAGLDATRYSGRSLRRGMVLAATEHGVSEGRIMAHTGHRSRRLVRRYMAETRDPGSASGRRARVT